ncbi:MAG TPA: HAD-IA family hydrolase [Fastidiosipila sp.]|nr:HAD-IA family hydrolase [Eubacteriales bacterium]HHU03963.1 HAD-IA family hydrolase [Fastidiosipila sp.]
MTKNPNQKKIEVEAVLFDMDGTLIDTIGLIVAGHEYTWKEHTGAVPPREDILSKIGKPLQQAYPGWEEETPDMLVTYRNWCAGKTDTHTGLYVGVVPMLEELQKMNFRLGLVSSRFRVGIDDCMRVYGLDDYFEILLAQEDSHGHKPGPEPLLAAAERMSITDMSRILYVGDSVHDVKSAQAAGCLSAVVDWTSMDKDELRALQPDLWIYKASDLPLSLSRI